MVQGGINIGVLQSRIQWEDKEANFQNLERQLEKAASSRPDMVLLPEMSFTGFSMNTEITGEDGEFGRRDLLLGEEIGVINS